MNIAICDDMIDVLSMLNEYTQKFVEKEKIKSDIYLYNNGADLVNENIIFDIVLLDIEMEPLNGIETAIKLKNQKINTIIIFITGYKEFYHNAFKVHAFDYILKPLSEASINRVLDDAFNFIEFQNKKNIIYIKTDSGYFDFEINNIYYFEFISRKVKVKTVKDEYYITSSIHKIYDMVQDFDFLMPHKSFIVNLKHIKSIKGNNIYMIDNNVIPLAQKQASAFRSKFQDFLQDTFYLI